MRIQCIDKFVTIPTIARTRRKWDKRVKRNAWIALGRAVMQHGHYIVHYCLYHADENRYLMTHTNHWSGIVMRLRTTRVRVTARRKSFLFIHELVGKPIVKPTACDAINNCNNIICRYAAGIVFYFVDNIFLKLKRL